MVVSRQTEQISGTAGGAIATGPIPRRSPPPNDRQFGRGHLGSRLIETCEKECNAKESDSWSSKDITRCRKALDDVRHLAVEHLKQVRYFWRQAHWLTERFPKAELCDVEGLVKLVNHKELKANDWSLTPGRYVGVAPEEVDDDFDFEEALREIHVELDDLNAEALTLAATIKRNFEELGA